MDQREPEELMHNRIGAEILNVMNETWNDTKLKNRVVVTVKLYLDGRAMEMVCTFAC